MGQRRQDTDGHAVSSFAELKPRRTAPGLTAAMIVAHLYLVVKLGAVAPPWIKAERREQKAVRE